ncbi:MAG: hypothetical protein RLZZ280_574 [Pseudomonadota bacterium]|jgi:hypothetical protein
MMTNAASPLENMTQTLQQCQRGDASTAHLARAWRLAAAQLPLPPRYGEVLHGLLDRMESGALFTEESCSFSQKDQLQALQTWLDKARDQLQRQGTPEALAGHNTPAP